MKPLSVVIFSKDRAAQLDLCLKSIFKNMEDVICDNINIDIIYTSSTEDFEIGYKFLINEWNIDDKIRFLRETAVGGFRGALESSIKNWSNNVLFFTDDDILYRNFNADNMKRAYQSLDSQDLFCVSLRLGKNTFVQDQYRNMMCPIPEEVIAGKGETRFWNWKWQPNWSNFGYPFSVDGHIFRSSFAKDIIQHVDYYNPNSLEGKASAYVRKNMDSLPPKMCCFEKGSIVNTPLNRVQETCLSVSGVFFAGGAKELNEKFLNGYRLSLEKMDFSTVIGVHQEIRLCWEKDKCC